MLPKPENTLLTISALDEKNSLRDRDEFAQGHGIVNQAVHVK